MAGLVLAMLVLTPVARAHARGDCPGGCPEGQVCTPEGACLASPFAEPAPGAPAAPPQPAPAAPDPVPVLVVEDQTGFQGDGPEDPPFGAIGLRLHADVLGILPPLRNASITQEDAEAVFLLGAAGFVLDGHVRLSPRVGLGVQGLLGRQVVLAELETVRGTWGQLGMLIRIFRRARRRAQLFGDIVPTFHGTAGGRGGMSAAGFGVRGAIGLRAPGRNGFAFVGALSLFLPFYTRMSFDIVTGGRASAYTLALPILGFSVGAELSG